MKNLPVQLIDAVAESITSTSDLLSLRAVNATCHHLVTPYAFRTVYIRNNIQSAQDCQRIIASPSLATHVRAVVYDPRDHMQFSLRPPQDIHDELEIVDLEAVLTETFCALPGCIHLERVTLNFWPSFRSRRGIEILEHPFWFTNRQVTVLHAIHLALKSSSRIRSLALHNVVLMLPSCYDFVASMTNAPLTHLSMCVVANAELGAWYGSKSLNGALSALLPASNANLTSLVLRSPRGLYHSLHTRLGAYDYPALETLVLEQIVFDPTPSVDGIEQFIVRHGASLRRLALHGCCSYVPDVATPLRRWSAIWGNLEDALTALSEIVAGDGVRHGYAYLDGANGYVRYPSLPAALASEDEEVYLQFRERMHLRSSVQ